MAISNTLTLNLNRHYVTLRSSHAMANSSAGLLYFTFGLVLLSLHMNQPNLCGTKNGNPTELALLIAVGLLLLVFWSMELKPATRQEPAGQESRDSPPRQVQWKLFLLSILSLLAALIILVWSCARLQSFSILYRNCTYMSTVPPTLSLVISLSSLTLAFNILAIPIVCFYVKCGVI